MCPLNFRLVARTRKPWLTSPPCTCACLPLPRTVCLPPRPIYSGADTEQGPPRGVGVPYYPVDGSAEGGTGGVGVDPDPLSVSDLPAPLMSFTDFLLCASSGETRSGSSGSGCANGDLGEGGRGEGGGGGGGGGGDGGIRPRDEMIHFESTPFDHPVFIMFSSGTTGLPKCMVHGAGGGCGSGLCVRRPGSSGR